MRVLALGTVALVTICLGASATPPSPRVHDYVDRALAGLSEGLYGDTSEWHDAARAARSRLAAADSVTDTYGELAKLTQLAGGSHSSFATPATAAGWNVRQPGHQFALPEVAVAGQVATLTLPALETTATPAVQAYLAAARKIFAAPQVHEACAWVVDLAANTGGNMHPMLLAVSPLLDDGVVSHFERRDGTVMRVFVSDTSVVWEGRDSGTLAAFAPLVPLPKDHDAPIAIVQSHATASAAEAVILAFRGQSGVATFGTPTAGFTTVNDGFRLPDGAVVTLSFAQMGDREGAYPRGPISADVPFSHTDASRAAAQRWAAEHCAASR